jgi:hypothetical protein
MPDSFDYTTGTNSENVRLLQALIDDAPEYTEETNSRNANILKSIINNTEYIDAPQSEIEELLLRLKAKIGGEIEVDELTVTENGTYDAGLNKAYNPVKVELPLDGKTITENGTYTASDDNLAGFNEVTVAVEGYAKKSIANTPTDIATFNASALPMPSLTVSIEATQSGSGDPSPTNVRPISGWSAVNVYDTGINVWDEEWVIGTISTSTGEYSTSGDRVCSKNYIRVEPNTLYYKQNFAWQFYYDEYKNFISATSIADGVFTTPNNAHYMKFYTSSAYGQTYNNDISINYPSTDTSHHAYNGQTYTIDLGGTRYGGTLDVVSGKLVVTHIIIKADTLNWYYLQNIFYSGSVGISADGSTDINSDFVCSFAKSVNKEWNQLSNNECTLRKNLYSQGYYSLCVKNTEYTNATDFKNSLDSTSEITFPIATPLTIQLTPTAVKSLLGTNNIWADSGDVQSGEYMEAL